MNRIAFLLVLFFIAGCSKKGDSIPVYKIDQDTGTVQYGTPFNGVPDTRDVSLYQVNIRSFSASHDFKGVTNRLDQMKSLGINVIYLMPIYPVGIVKSVNSPYCVRDYKAVNPEFGTLTDLRNLIDGAHARNMAVILDFVANHTSFDNAWITEHPDWYVHDGNNNIVSPMTWTDVAQLNFSKPDMRLALIDAMKYWVLAANCDGFRCDYADGPPVDFWKQAIDTLRAVKTHKLLMMAEGRRSTNFSAGFDFNFGFSFYDLLKNIYKNNASVTQINNLNTSEFTGSSDGNQVIRYITNHDVNSSDGTPLDLFGGQNGSMAAFVIVAYMKSVPMVYNGQEVATPYRLTFPFTSTTIDWSINPGVTQEYQKVLTFRNNSTAIRRGSLTSYSTADVCAFSKVLPGDTVLVLSNLRNQTITYTVPSNLANRTWNDAFDSGTVTLSSQLTLQPFSYKVLKK